jgi:prepilin-type N-terminal cleavage/methylation domain-containing protein
MLTASHSPGARARRGFSVVEVLVALVIGAIVGNTVLKLLVRQSEFHSRLRTTREARAVSRGGLNALLGDLRSVEPSGGVVGAAPTVLTVRVPYAFGITCDENTFVIQPVDSLEFAASPPTGYAYRTPAGAYVYRENESITRAGSASDCTNRNINMPGTEVDSVYNVTAGLPTNDPAIATSGTPVLLYRTVAYSFAASTAVPGQTGLWRMITSTGERQEIAAPFHASARFRYIQRSNSDLALDAAPALLSDLVGVELRLVGLSERPMQGGDAVARDSMVTAVFFRNRLH